MTTIAILLLVGVVGWILAHMRLGGSILVNSTSRVLIANCGTFIRRADDPDVPVSWMDIYSNAENNSRGELVSTGLEPVRVPRTWFQRCMTLSAFSERYELIRAEGTSMEQCGISPGAYVWIDKQVVAYAPEDLVLIANRTGDSMKIRKLSRKLSGGEWETGCAADQGTAIHREKRFLGRVVLPH